MIIAVDGPTASGKGTLAKALAAHFGLPFMDTGLLYRAVGRQVQLDGGDPDDLYAHSVLRKRPWRHARHAAVGGWCHLDCSTHRSRAERRQLHRRSVHRDRPLRHRTAS